jgi:hypothetical protein
LFAFITIAQMQVLTIILAFAPIAKKEKHELCNFNVAKNIFANWEKIFSLLRKLFFLVGKIHQPQKAF